MNCERRDERVVMMMMMDLDGIIPLAVRRVLWALGTWDVDMVWAFWSRGNLCPENQNNNNGSPHVDRSGATIQPAVNHSKLQATILESHSR